MADNLRDIPFSELMAYVVETEAAPNHIGCIEIFEAQGESSTEAAQRIYKDFLATEVGAPFNCIPVFSRFKRPQWSTCKNIDLNHHIKFLTLESPASRQQLLDLVGKLHSGKMDREVPGFENFIIDGLADNQFAIYHKYHHAYMDGSAFTMRFERLAARGPGPAKAVPIWAPCPAPANASGADTAPTAKPADFHILDAVKDANKLMVNTVLQATRLRKSDAPLPFSAPRSLVNQVKHGTRAIGEGAMELAKMKQVAKKMKVSINEVALALVGAGLENYLGELGELQERDLVAGCPMAVRREGDAEGGNMIAALFVKLGKPGSDIVSRLEQVHASSKDAKASARSVGREGLTIYQTAVMGTAGLLGITPMGKRIPAIANINVSNVPASAMTYFQGGAAHVRTIPVSALSGSAINITFSSQGHLMEFGVISDAVLIPQPARLAAAIVAAFDELYATVLAPQKSTRRSKILSE